MNIYRQYEKSLSKEEKQALSLCTKLADDIGIKIYLVGGIVRDILLNRKFNDIDILVEDDAIVFGKILQQKFPSNVKIIAENEKFKTLKVEFFINKTTFEADIASTRSEVYEYPCALPILADTGVPLNKDIIRRDFTVNALAMSLNSKNFCQIFDETQNGIDDIEKGLVRILHNDSFFDDPSRIVRALKYRTKLNFSLEENTEILQNNCLDSNKYTNDCQERIKKEAIETLNLCEASCFDKFLTENIYKLIIGETSKKDIPNGNFICKIIDMYISNEEKENIWLIFLCLIFNFSPTELMKKNIEKLALKKRETSIIHDFFKLTSVCEELNNATDDYDVYEFFSQFSNEAIVAALILCKETDICEKFHLYMDKLRYIKLSVSGNDIAKYGIQNGIIYKEILTEVLREKINRKLHEKEERQVLQNICKMIKNEQSGI